MTMGTSTTFDKIVDPWFDDYDQQDDDIEIGEYDITSTPNDFNILTINNFIESGAVKIPGFQRNYVWDIVRASKLIESLLLGLPVPQIFLYEESRNKFLVIDGQQRLMSIYYFIKQRFPRKEKRVELRHIFDGSSGRIPEHILNDDQYFEDFKLSLPSKLPRHPNKFKDMKYKTLGDYKIQFELRPIRNIIVKQNAPSDDTSSIYEIFNRLNSGGVNLDPQEIRASLYHSEFYDMLHRINVSPGWRRLLRSAEPDLHMKDIEILLRVFAMLIDGKEYAPSLTKFLNQFSKKSQKNKPAKNQYLETLFGAFLEATVELPDDIFVNKNTRKFHVALFEAVFHVACKKAFSEQTASIDRLDAEKIVTLENDEEFIENIQKGSTQTAKVTNRMTRAFVVLEGRAEAESESPVETVS